MARVAARIAPRTGTGWTPVAVRLGTRCRKMRPGARLWLAPCTGMLTCFTVRESRSRAAGAIRLARSCGHGVSGCTMNKAMRPPSGSANGTGTLLPARSRIARKEELRATCRADAQTYAAKGNARRRQHADQGALSKRRRCRRTDALLRQPIGVSPRVAEGDWLWTVARCDRDAFVRQNGRDARTVTEQGGTAIGHADWTHESAE